MDLDQKIPIAWVCETCGVQAQASATPPADCPICLDERQYVGWAGQRWLRPDILRRQQEIVFTVEDGVQTLALRPGVAINQRAFLIPHPGGHVMWECLAAVTETAVARIQAMGGVTDIAISHPHFYAAMVDWCEALGGVPIHLHARDRVWVQRPSPRVRFWAGETLDLAPAVQLVRLGGHFDGSSGLWWKTGPRPGGSLFPGDAVQVAMDRRFATFMYSYPNGIPLAPAALNDLAVRLDGLTFEDVFGFSTGRQIVGDGKARIEASLTRYRAAVTA